MSDKITMETIINISQSHPSIQQFENSLKFIQGGTGMTLDRMLISLRRLCKEMIEEGVKLASEKKEVELDVKDKEASKS